MTTDFADVSSYQSSGVDLAAYLRAGHDRILIKATEGTDYTNPFLAQWWAWAGRLGLGRGAYHFARPSRSTGTQEADYFVAALRAAGGAGPRDWVCLDAEDPDDHANGGGRHAADFCARMAQLGVPSGVVYTGTWYAGPAKVVPATLPAGWRRLHLATYNAAEHDDALILPPGWSREQVVARQYTNAAVQPGIPGKSDRNRVLREWLTLEQEVSSVSDANDTLAEAAKIQGFSGFANMFNAKPGGIVDMMRTLVNRTGGKDVDRLGQMDGKLNTLAQALIAWAGPDHPVTQILQGTAVPDPPLTVDRMLSAIADATDALALARFAEASGARLRELLTVSAGPLNGGQ